MNKMQLEQRKQCCIMIKKSGDVLSVKEILWPYNNNIVM